MRRRVEQHVPAGEADRQLKLGPGGLRDVEFSRPAAAAGARARRRVAARPAPRSRRSRRCAAAATSAATTPPSSTRPTGCCGRWSTGSSCTGCGGRTSCPPTRPTCAGWAASVGHRRDPAAELVEPVAAPRRARCAACTSGCSTARCSTAAARLAAAEARLTPEAARARLAALGYRDPAGAMRHIEALTAGVSRRAAIQRTLLPVMLGLVRRRGRPGRRAAGLPHGVSEELGTTPLVPQDAARRGRAAERLAHVLAASRYAADLLVRAPESVAILGDDGGLQPAAARRRCRPRMLAAAAAPGRPRTTRSTAARVVRRRELFRVAVGRPDRACWTSTPSGARSPTSPPPRCSRRSTSPYGAVEDERGAARHPRCSWSAWGGWAAARWATPAMPTCCSCTSPIPAADERRGAAGRAPPWSRSCAGCSARPARTRSSAWTPTCGPEGKQRPAGALACSPTRAYYERWSLVVGGQALLRATPVAGDEELGREFLALVDPLRWPEGGLSRARRPRDPHAEGPDGVRAAAPRARPQDALQARDGAACPTSSGPCSCCSCGTASRCRRCAPPRPWTALEAARTAGLLTDGGRRGARRVVAAGVAAAQRRACCGGDDPWTGCPATCATPTAWGGSSAGSPARAPRWPRTTAGWRDAPDLPSCPTSTKAT